MRFIRILWLFFIPFCFINLSINIFAVTSHCLHHQESALLHLRHSLIFNPAKSKKMVHWNQNDDCCEWNGVTCHKGRVIALDLSEEYISGGLDNSSSLFKLQYLQELNLAYNSFQSDVPSELHKLRNLRYLNLSNAGFVGQIPIEISYLTKLAFLDLSTSFSSLHTLKLENPNITIFLKNFTRIKELHLDGVRILAKGKEWGHALSSLQNLQVLSMSFCNLSGPIDSSLSKLKSLLILRLNQNNMASIVPESLVSLTNLTTLQLSSCNLSGVFPKKIFQIPSLLVLDISYNKDLHGFLPDFQHHGSFQTLNLSHTNFSGQVPNSIQNLKLSTLDLSSCQFNGTLPSSMSKLTQLIHVDLSFNNFTGRLPSFSLLQNLASLSLYQNGLSGEISSSHFEGLEYLFSIDLRGNSLTGRLPLSIFTLPSLRELLLSYNGFEGPLDEIPNVSSSELQILDISRNNLQGPIPVSVFHLRRLTFLKLSSNKFNGTIHLGAIRRMENLTTLDLSNNNLLIDAALGDNLDLSSFPNLNNLMLASCKLRDFPIFLRNQSNLLYLDLSSNQIHGVIPNWIWRFDSMVYLNLSNNFLTDLEGPFQNISSNLFLLDLHSNQLQGHAPIFPKYLIYLDYSNNRFSSIAPLDIGNHIPFAYFLSLSNNSFHGEIHESFCNISTLRLLDLSYNNFSGTIPECLTRMRTTLRVLNLSGNKLKGQISDTFSTSCALRFLDLNDNFLGGAIPRSFANCKNLQVLNLGNNQLIDRFPCFLRNISTLRVMILRSNNFHGTLECPNSVGGWEALQIVDLASNNFSGTLPATLLQSWKALMPEKDKVGSEFGHLFFYMFDNVNSRKLKNLMSPVNIDLALKLAKVVSIEPTFTVDLLNYDFDAEDFGGQSFQDSVTIVNKGRQMKYAKILIAFTSLDFSYNHFEGPIPEELMNFKALHALNLSQNVFSGLIPSSLGKLKYLESLDLSINAFSGNIPYELASLSFLAVLNLSYNHLIGPIPTGTQIQSFEVDSFEGNEGLCGPPLTQSCSSNGFQGLSPPASATTESKVGSSIDWNFLSAELGFTFGFGIIIMPLIFWKHWRPQYFKYIDYLLCKMVPQLGFVYEQRGGKKYRTLKWMPF